MGYTCLVSLKKEPSMRIRFVHHSAYLVELDRHILVFDYFNKGDLGLAQDQGKNLVFFVSHGHEDHFHPDIFAYKDQASYVISSDVMDLDPEADITLISQGQTAVLGEVRVHAFDSTDMGVSFIVEVEGKRIYHAGDHNYWLWPHYSPQDIGDMHSWFTGEVDKAARLGPVDVAFSLVDPRMKDFYHLTGAYCLDTLKPGHFFPLHLWGDFGLSKTFKDRFEDAYPASRIYALEGDGQEFII